MIDIKNPKMNAKQKLPITHNRADPFFQNIKQNWSNRSFFVFGISSPSSNTMKAISPNSHPHLSFILPSNEQLPSGNTCHRMKNDDSHLKRASSSSSSSRAKPQNSNQTSSTIPIYPFRNPNLTLSSHNRAPGMKRNERGRSNQGLPGFRDSVHWILVGHQYTFFFFLLHHHR